MGHLCEFVLRQDLIRPCGFAWGHLKVNCPKGKRGHPGVPPPRTSVEGEAWVLPHQWFFRGNDVFFFCL